MGPRGFAVFAVSSKESEINTYFIDTFVVALDGTCKITKRFDQRPVWLARKAG
jgi:hypothetical protein